MSNQQKRGFRLPWAGERDPDDTANDQPGAERDDLGEGPFELATDARFKTTDAAPAGSDVPDETSEAAMIDTEATSTDSAAAPVAAGAPQDGAWPSSDRRSTDSARPPIRVEGESRLPRRDNPLVAGLVKAMREAAIASRNETAARLEAEAKARVDAIRARATLETAELKKRADEDVTGIREWSKAEIARVRQQTDDRIEARRVELVGETERHAAGVDRLVDEVQTTVAAFGADMEQFFGRLLAEEDPAKLAALAEQAPDPPDLTGDGPSAMEFAGETFDPGLQADAAAEAEAAASEGFDPTDIEAWPTAALAAARRSDPVTSASEPNGPEATRLLVSGLTSVAGISAFKGALAGLPGVRSVSVSSGDPGVFVFAVNHDAGVDLDSGVSSLPAFSAQVTDANNDGFTVVAHEPAA